MAEMATEAAQPLPGQVRTEHNMRLVVVEGALSSVMGTAVGGAFLTGFALLLGATDTHIGLLAAIPALANLTQLFGAALIRRFGNRKGLCLLCFTASRALWLGILSIPFFFLGDGWTDVRVWLLMLGIALISLLSSAAGVAWLSWITDLVPDEIRGRFNGRRSMYAAITAMVVGLGAGGLIDLFGGREHTLGFSVLFGIGVLFGFAGLWVMSRMEEPPLQQAADKSAFFADLSRPLKDVDFRRFVAFKVAWSFAVGLAGPFFSVYMIRTLDLPFSLIATFGVVSSLATIFGMRIWGGLVDRVGPKPLLLLTSAFQAAIPLFWLAGRADWTVPLWMAHAVAGFMSAGTGLATTSLLVRLAPREHSTGYFGMQAASTGLAGATAPLVGGAVGGLIAGATLVFGPVSVSGLHILFLVSAALRFSSLLLLKRVEPGRPMTAEQMLPMFARLQAFHPVQAVGLGLAAAENVNASLVRGSIAMELAIEKRLQVGRDIYMQAKRAAENVDRRIEGGLDRHEARLDRLLDRLAELFSGRKRPK